ncbi:MAG TPA: hypothetical protein ENH91_12105 [Leeuwenhoekiella sp.]|nr:hypothetical protein [Leeuwenhoekiella sp.]
MTKNSSLEKTKESPFLALQEQNAEIGELLKANLGTRRIDPWSFDTATWPSGKASVFEIPTLEGTDAVKEITGIILHWKYERIFYSKDYDEGVKSRTKLTSASE